MLSDKIVSFVMTADGLITVDVKDRLRQVRKLLTQHPIHHLPVLDGNKLVGIISPTDLLQLGIDVEEGGDDVPDSVWDGLGVDKAMETSLVTLHPRDSLLHAVELLVKERFSSLPVVDEFGELVGILTTRDLLRLMIEEG